jgi:hypothetical protein
LLFCGGSRLDLSADGDDSLRHARSDLVGGDAEEGVDPERSLAWLAEDEGGRVGGEAGPVRDPRHRLGKDASLVVGEEGRVEGFRHVCDVD